MRIVSLIISYFFMLLEVLYDIEFIKWLYLFILTLDSDHKLFYE